MEKAAVILAGGFSKRFGQDKGLVRLAGKPLVSHVFESASQVVEEVIVVVSSIDQKKTYLPLFPAKTEILVDVEDFQSPLAGALTGFAKARSDCSVLLPCDTPFVSKEVLQMLFEMSHDMDAVIPRWPNGYFEPLQAVYRTSSARVAAEEAVKEGGIRLWSMIALLEKVRYLSTRIIKEVEPRLTTFFNINTLMNLKKAEKLIEKKKAT
ncbi:MAG: molybdenum cofactor guanylyltransferase [Candidatus Bathyarchaeota archaeon]|nr:molybdenum cofactor guanylyltransferase [Candidatus Bathyarchaeota archaeon]